MNNYGELIDSTGSLSILSKIEGLTAALFFVILN